MTETWWIADTRCEECGSDLATNGEILKCYNCGWGQK